MQATSDEVLIGRIAAGDRLAMQVLFARHHVRVYRFVLRLVSNPTLAEDLISEVFLDVWRQAGKGVGRRRGGGNRGSGGRSRSLRPEEGQRRNPEEVPDRAFSGPSGDHRP